jgi:uncharacterized membrane protein
MKRGSRSQWLWMISVLAMSVIALQVPVFAQTPAPAADQPERLLTMSVEYLAMDVVVGKTVSLDVTLNNKGKADEDVKVWLENVPEGWTATLKTFKFPAIASLQVPSGEKKTLVFSAEPGEQVKIGKYDFTLKAQTPDGQFQMTRTITANVVEEKKAEKPKDSKNIKLSTTYPVLRGPTDVKFEFSIEVQSAMDEDRVFDLFAEGPKDWDVNFKPAYETKYISSLQIPANQSKTVSVEIQPEAIAQAGEYPIKVRVSSGEEKAEMELTIVLTGTYKIDAGTADGLLSLNAKPGTETKISFYVKNTGSAPQNGINFMSFKPENWKVEFKPEKIEKLDAGELKQVEMLITPANQALVGDYSVAVDVQGEKNTTKTLEFRTTVKASSAWAGIGILIIVGVVLGLTWLFRSLGRR